MSRNKTVTHKISDSYFLSNWPRQNPNLQGKPIFEREFYFSYKIEVQQFQNRDKFISSTVLSIDWKRKFTAWNFLLPSCLENRATIWLYGLHFLFPQLYSPQILFPLLYRLTSNFVPQNCTGCLVKFAHYYTELSRILCPCCMDSAINAAAWTSIFVPRIS